MRLLLFLLLCLLNGYTHAAIYKSVLPDGTVIFTDQPELGAEKIDVPNLQTYPPPSVSTAIDPQISPPQEAAVIYTSLIITSPANDATIRENSGKVEIHVATEPPLQAQAGHKILVKMDGQAIGEPATTQQYVLDNVDRGTHSLQASILDASGNTLVESETVIFHLKRISILFQKNPANGN